MADDAGRRPGMFRSALSRVSGMLDRLRRRPVVTVPGQGGQSGQNYNSLLGLLNAMRSNAPGAWTDDRMAQSRSFTGINYLAIHPKAMQASRADIKIYRRSHNDPDGKKLLGHKNPAQRLLDNPNPRDTRQSFIYRIVQQLDLTGSALVWCVPNGFGAPCELYSIPTALAVPLPMSPVYPCGAFRVQPLYPYGPFAYFPGGSTAAGAVIDSRQIFRVMYPHPLLTYDGYSPLSAMRLQADTVNSIDQARWNTQQTGLDPSAMITFDPAVAKPDNATIDLIREQLNALYAGPTNAGRVLIGAPGANITPYGNRPIDMAWTEGWEQLTGFVLAGYGTPKAVAGFSSAGSFSELYAALQQLYLMNLEPCLEWVAATFNKFLIPRFDKEAYLELTPHKITDEQVQETQLTGDVAARSITKDEYRAKRKLPPLGADKGGEDWAGTDGPNPAGQPAGPGPGNPALEANAANPTAKPQNPVEQARPDNPQGEGSLPGRGWAAIKSLEWAGWAGWASIKGVEYDESKHPRGQPKNAGQFAPSGGGNSHLAGTDGNTGGAAKTTSWNAVPEGERERVQKVVAEAQQKAQGNGPEADKAKQTLERFAQVAKSNGLDPDALLKEMGGAAGSHPNSKPPWKMTPEEFASAKMTWFTTAQGSRYIFANGQTIRIKSQHTGHDKGDVGMKRGSEVTLFIDPAAAQEVGMWQTHSGQGKRIIVQGDEVLLTSINHKTGQRGIDGRIKVASKAPKVGLAPLELNDRSSQGEGWYSGSHPGNAIGDMKLAGEPERQELVAAARATKMLDDWDGKAWDESKHPRGQPKNKGQFGPGAPGAQRTTPGAQATTGAQARKKARRRDADNSVGNSVGEQSDTKFIGSLAQLGRTSFEVIARLHHGAEHLGAIGKEFVADKVQDNLSKLPPRYQALARGAWIAARGLTTVAFATWKAGQAAAEAVARLKGATPEEAARLRQTMSAVDLIAAKPVMLVLPAIGLGPLALASSMVPIGSLTYLAYAGIDSAVKRILTARQRVRDVLKSGKKSMGVPNVDVVEAIFEAIKAHDASDEFQACLLAAIDETGDLREAIEVASAAMPSHGEHQTKALEHLPAAGPTPGFDPPVQEKAIRHPYHDVVAAAAREVEQPTDGQKEAGNYKKGHLTIHGLAITLENARGSYRSGTDKDGKTWRQRMAAHYGYIKRTESESDGDHVDVFIGPHPESEIVFIIDQFKADGTWDEHKAVMGALNAEEAKAIYLACYSPGWTGFGGMTAMPIEEFKRWAFEGDTSKPLSVKPEPQAPDAEHDRRSMVDGKAWDESKHPRGQPKNRGQFGPRAGAAKPADSEPDDTKAESPEAQYAALGVRAPAFKAWFGDWENDPAGASKVVDDDGKPLVVYHGTDKEFDEFAKATNAHTRVLGIDTYFFTASKAVASTYTTQDKGKLVAAYLNLRNPLVVDAGGGEWIDALADIQDKLTTYHGPKDKEFQKGKLAIFDKYSPYDIETDWEGTVSEEDKKELSRLQRAAQDERVSIRKSLKLGSMDPTPVWEVEQDGIIIKNSLDMTDRPVNEDMIDGGSYSPIADIYVAFKPTQIKAVDNAGTFNPSDPHLRKAWDESKHPRGQPDNAGQFGPGGASGETKPADRETNDKPAETKEPNAREQYAQLGTRAPAFKAWFGDWEDPEADASKVVNADGEPQETGRIDGTGSVVKDKDGKPMGVYHGTSRGKFDAFDKGRISTGNLYGPGFYFTEDEGIAGEYSSKDSRAVKGRELSRDLTPDDIVKLREWAKENSKRNIAEGGWTAKRIGKILDYLPKKHEPTDEQLSNFTVTFLGDTWSHAAEVEDGGQAIKAMREAMAHVGIEVKDAPAPAVLNCYLNIRNPFKMDVGENDALRDRLAQSLRTITAEELMPHIEKEISESEGAEAPEEVKLQHARANKESLFRKLLPTMGQTSTGAFMGSTMGQKTYDIMVREVGKHAANYILQRNGFDGITHIGGDRMGGGYHHRVWIAFEPTQIKSVENEGTFSPTDPNMAKAWTAEQAAQHPRGHHTNAGRFSAKPEKDKDKKKKKEPKKKEPAPPPETPKFDVPAHELTPSQFQARILKVAQWLKKKFPGQYKRESQFGEAVEAAINRLGGRHKEQVERALRHGQVVPEKVMKHYPELRNVRPAPERPAVDRDAEEHRARRAEIDRQARERREQLEREAADFEERRRRNAAEQQAIRDRQEQPAEVGDGRGETDRRAEEIARERRDEERERRERDRVERQRAEHQAWVQQQEERARAEANRRINEHLERRQRELRARDPVQQAGARLVADLMAYKLADGEEKAALGAAIIKQVVDADPAIQKQLFFAVFADNRPLGNEITAAIGEKEGWNNPPDKNRVLQPELSDPLVLIGAVSDSQKKYLAEREKLRSAKVVASELMGGGINGSYKVKFDDGYTQGIWKPVLGETPFLRAGEKGGSYFRREAAASFVANLIGMEDLVPPTVTKEIDGKLGSVMKFVPGCTEAYKFAQRGRSPFDGDEDAARAAAFDYLIGHNDRHGKNWMLTDTGKLVLIDNGLSFPTEYKSSDYQNSAIVPNARDTGLRVPAGMSDLMVRWPRIAKGLRNLGIEDGAISLMQKRAQSLSDRAGREFNRLPRLDQAAMQ